MVVHRKDTAIRKLKVKKSRIFFERLFLQKNPEDRTNRCTQGRHGKKLKLKKTYRKNVLT